MATPTPGLAARQRRPLLAWYDQHRTLVLGSAAGAAALYLAYRAFTARDDSSEPECSPSSSAADSASSSQPAGASRARRPAQSQFQRLRSTLANYSEAASTLAETAALVSSDLRTFLSSDSAELPQSLRQLNKLLQSAELQETVSTVTSSVVRGAARAVAAGDGAAAGAPAGPPLVDTIIEAVLSERGRGLVGMAVGIATRNATSAVCEFMERRMDVAAASPGAAGSGFSLKDILDLLTSEQGEKLLTLLLTKSIRTGVVTYVESTTGYNPYTDMLASIVRTEHRDAVTDILSRVTASFCREVALAYRRTAASGAGAGGVGSGAGSVGGGAVNHLAAKYAAAAAAAAVGGGAPVAAAGCREGASSCGQAAGCGDCAPTEAPIAAPPVTRGSSGPLAATCSGSRNGRISLSAPQHWGSSSSTGGSGSVAATVLSVTAGCGSANAAGALGRTLGIPQPPPWLRQVVELARERDVRSLAVSVVSTAAREGTRGAVEGLLQGVREGELPRGVGAGALALPPGLSAGKLYVLATLAVSLAMYALSPRVLLL